MECKSKMQFKKNNACIYCGKVEIMKSTAQVTTENVKNSYLCVSSSIDWKDDDTDVLVCIGCGFWFI